MLKRNKHILRAVNLNVLFLMFTAITVYSQPYPDEIKHILELKDTRSTGRGNELTDNLNSGNNKIAKVSAWALSNISDTATIKDIGEVLIQSVNGITEDNISLSLPILLSFALGQMNSSEGNEYLVNALNLVWGKKNELVPQVTAEIINNLSKTGNENEFKRIIELQSGDNRINDAIAMAIARFGMRKIKSDAGFRKLAV